MHYFLLFLILFQQISSYFNVTVPGVEPADISLSISQYIPKEILKDYKDFIAELDHIRTGIFLAKPMDSRLGKPISQSLFQLLRVIHFSRKLVARLI